MTTDNDTTLYLILENQESENIIGLDPYILNSFSYLDPIKINVSQCMTSLLKFEITVFLWLSLPVHSGSLKRTDLSGQPSFF